MTAATLTRAREAAEWLFSVNTGPVRRDERKVWASAESLADLCVLMDRWLAGDLKSQPTYYGSVDVDEDEAPGLTRACRRLNQIGFLTDSSQAGVDEAEGGRCWTQLAAVDGFATPELVADLRARLAGTRYGIQAFEARQFGVGARVPVTWVDGEVCTHFGGGQSRRWIRSSWASDVGAGAVRELCDALQVVIYDPEPGRNTLWADLIEVTS